MTISPESNLSTAPPMGHLLPPSPQWQNGEEPMRHWLQAKAEEDRRRQEEEITRQESLRLERRKIEQTMLRDSFQAGVPPYMVPLIFAGIGGGNMSRPTWELAQPHLDHSGLHQQQQQQQQLPPPPTPPQQQQQQQQQPRPQQQPQQQSQQQPQQQQQQQPQPQPQPQPQSQSQPQPQPHHQHQYPQQQTQQQLQQQLPQQQPPPLPPQPQYQQPQPQQPQPQPQPQLQHPHQFPQQQHAQQQQQRLQQPQGPPTPQQQPSQYPVPPPSQPQLARRPSQSYTQEVRRDNRTIPPNPYATQPLPQTSSTLVAPHQAVVPASPTQQPYGRSPTSLLHGTPTDTHPSPAAPLSRLNTSEMHIQHPPTNVGVLGYPAGLPAPPPTTAPAKQEAQLQQSPSTSIYFHHWVPPGQSQPGTPSGKNQPDSTLSSSHAHLRSEFQSSPGRKRKAQGPHQPAPPPSAENSPAMQHYSPRQTSPGGPGRRANAQGHHRQTSDASGGAQESRYREGPELEQDHAHRQSRLMPEAAINPSGSVSDRDRNSSAPNRVVDGSEDPSPIVPQSRYTETQSPSQPGPYPSYNRPPDSTRTSGPPTPAPPRHLEPPA
ncbi:hypothetical protein V8E54_002186 [Elaphomyces granulatus]